MAAHFKHSGAQPSRLGSVREFVSGERLLLTALAGASLAGGLAEAAYLILVTRSAFAITDGHHDIKILGADLSLGVTVAIALVLVSIRLGFALLASWQAARLTSSVMARTRRDLSAAFLSARWSVQHDDRIGQLQELLTTFADRAADLLNNLALGITATFTLLALLGAAVAVNPPGALIVLAGSGLLAFVLRPIRGIVRRRAKDAARTGMSFATSLSEISSLGMEMHVFGVQPEARRQVGELVRANENAERQLRYLRGVIPAVYAGLAYYALIAALGFVALSNTTNLTGLGTIMLITLRSLSYGQAAQTATANAASSVPFLSQLHEQTLRYREGQPQDGDTAIGHLGVLSVRNIWFGYDPEEPILQDLSFDIEPGEIVGIVGPSGSGKSTLVQLLLGLRDPDHGQIYSDGRPIEGLRRDEWTRKVTFVPQQARLITGSIADNIRFLRPSVPLAKIEEAAALANLLPDLERFPEGLDRSVGPGGSQLSGGQQQRVCIARALVEDPDLLILDEPTSVLDVHSEHLIRTTLEGLKDRMTVVIIAHRLSTLEICDRIMVIQDGQLMGFDTPDRLSKTSAFYHDALVLSGLK